MQQNPRNSRSTEAFFGRRRGKTMSPYQAAALEAGLRAHGLDLTQPAPLDLRTCFAAQVEEIRLEIGFGGGEHLLSEAGSHPATGFIGVEPFVNSLAKLMAAVDSKPLANLRVYDDDATRVLDWLPDASLTGIDLLYPDPWHKKRHWKRRFVNAANLDRFGRVMQRGGVFRFASDIADYVNWTLLEIRAQGQFEWQVAQADDWRRPYAGWPGTRYEAKAVREGRKPAYLTFRRT